ncbi:MAG: shikimate kinase [Akkermansia sp.]
MGSSEDRTSSKHIIFVGLMGCGKTTIGRELARLTGMSFLDMDVLIEEQIGKSISDIFKHDGEAHFRSLETALLRYLLEESPAPTAGCIISTGGGVIMRAENRELLRRLGFVIWLDVDVPILFERTARTNHRPLLQQGDAQETLRKLLEVRAPLYAESAHLRLDTSHMEIPDAVRFVKEASDEYFQA